MLDNYSHSTYFEVDTLEGINLIVEETQGSIFDLVMTKELEKSPSSLIENIRTSSKLDLLIEEPHEDPYY